MKGEAVCTDDGDGACIQSDDMTITISAENDCPEIAMSVRNFEFKEQGDSLVIIPEVSITDLDDVTLNAVVVKITNAQDDHESISTTAFGSVEVEQVSATEISLTGGATRIKKCFMVNLPRFYY